MLKNRLFLIFILTLTLIIVGCWDRREVDRITFPLALGIDSNQKGDGYMVFAQIAETKTAGQGGTIERNFVVLEGKGSTVASAIINMASQAPQQLSLQHVKALVISENLARSGVSAALEVVSRTWEFRPNVNLFVTSSSIKQLFQAKPTATIGVTTPFEGVNLVKERTNKVPVIELREFFQKMFTLGAEPIMGRAELTSKEKTQDIRLEGSAVFKKNKMVGWLNDEETGAWTIVKSSTGSYDIVAPFPGKKEQKLSFNPLASNCQIIPQISDNGVKIKLKVDFEANLTEETSPLPVNENTLKVIETVLNHKLENLIKNTVLKTQKELHSDIFGFGEKFRRKNPKYWQEHKNQWDSIYSELPTEVEVKSVIRRPGKISDPIAFPNTEESKAK